MTSTLSARARAWLGGLLAGAVVGVIGLVLAVVRPDAIERSELGTYDHRARTAAEGRPVRDDIVIVEVSEGDITWVEDNTSITWPWPRALFGYIATYTRRAGARAIVFDWLFQDRGQFLVSDAEDFGTALRDAGNTVIGLSLTRNTLTRNKPAGPWAALLGSFPSRDEATTAAIRLQAWSARTFLVGDGPVEVWYGGFDTREELDEVWTRLVDGNNARGLIAPGFDDDAEAPAPTVRKLDAATLARELQVADVIAERNGLPGDPPIPQRDGMDPPLGVIALGPARLGHVHQQPDFDGVLRHHTPLVQHDGRTYPSMPLAAFLVGHPGTAWRYDDGALVLGDRRLELDAAGRYAIRFAPAGSYRRISSYEILRSQQLIDEGKPPSLPDSTFKDAYVIVAATAHGLRDLRPTPVSKIHLGAVINANVLENLLDEAAITRASPLSDGLIALLLSLLAAASITLISRVLKRGLVAFPVMLTSTALAILGYMQLASYLMSSHDVWIAVAIPAASIATSSFVTLLVLSGLERTNRRFVQEALGRYTSPALVRALVDHPEYLSLDWGEEAAMSVYFSDIAGFTTISEQLTPKELVKLLNEYLTEMTDLVLAHGGVVDKYIGDAVMAFWGAPLPDPDHAKNAVRCAIAMRDRCDALRADWRERFGQDVFARAGVNSGTAIAGNMGSKHKYNYTVMGDMVNLAARLEGANKPYGTFLMISAVTAAAVGDIVDLRELDLVAVKGKEQPVTVYEVLDLKGSTTPEKLAQARAFEHALALYREARFADAQTAFEALVNTDDDAPSKLYVERCATFLATPPAGDWDGVWRMKEK